jgi:hypothetical protein
LFLSDEPLRYKGGFEIFFGIVLRFYSLSCFGIGVVAIDFYIDEILLSFFDILFKFLVFFELLLELSSS